jgi:hypothetical protein
MSARNIAWEVKAAGGYGWQPYHLNVPIVLKSGSLNLLVLSGPVLASTGIALKQQFTTEFAMIYYVVIGLTTNNAVLCGLRVYHVSKRV